MTLDKALYTTYEAAEILFGKYNRANYQKARRLMAEPDIAEKLVRINKRTIYWPRSVLEPMVGVK